MSALTSHTLQAPGAVLHYDIRPAAHREHPPLLLIGSPMGASGFTTLAGHFTDRDVVTYDPRGAERSKRTDDASQTTTAEHAADLRLLIEAIGTELVDIFATSGGAVNALVLVAEHPDLVRTLVAHEPPAADVLPDREEALAATRIIGETYQRAGHGAAMAKFIALVGHQGPIPAGFADHDGPDPAAFGLSVEDDGSRDDPLLGQNIGTCVQHRHDLDALSAASTRILFVAGNDSAGQLPYRATHALAQRLGTDALTFPGDHTGFLGGEYGMTGEPEAFAAALRGALDGH